MLPNTVVNFIMHIAADHLMQVGQVCQKADQVAQAVHPEDHQPVGFLRRDAVTGRQVDLCQRASADRKPNGRFSAPDVLLEVTYWAGDELV